MKSIICAVLVAAICLTTAIGIIDYTNFVRMGCRVDYSDPWVLCDETLYYGKLLTDAGVVDCWKTEWEWDRIIYRNLKRGKY